MVALILSPSFSIVHLAEGQELMNRWVGTAVSNALYTQKVVVKKQLLEDEVWSSGKDAFLTVEFQKNGTVL
jgi:hypothetical protein